MKSALKRGMGIGMVCAMACGAMLAGLFILPAYVVQMTGPSAVLVFLAAGLLYVPSALSKAEMATALPESGGDYVFIDRALGPLVGTVSGLGTWLTLVLKTALALAGLGYYLVVISPIFSGYETTVALVLTVVLVVVNSIGITHSGYLQCVLVALAVGVLSVFVAGGLPSLSTVPTENFFSDGYLGFLSATAFVIVSYAGLTKVVSAAEEIENPGEVIPLGIVVSLAGMTLLYTLVIAVMLGVVPLGTVGDGPYLNAPIAQPARAIAGKIGEVVLSVVAVLGLVSMANAGIMAASRYPFAMARYRQFPSFMFYVTPRGSTPVFSIFVTGGLLIGSIVFLPVMELAKLGSTFLLIVFFLVNAAPIVFRESDIEWYQPCYEAPFYPYLQLFGMLACGSLIGFMGLFGLLSALALVAVGVLWYLIYVRNRVNRTGVLLRRDESPRFINYDGRPPRTKVPGGSVLVPCFDVQEETADSVRRRVALARILADDEQAVHVVHVREVPAEGDGFEVEEEGEAPPDPVRRMLREDLNSDDRLNYDRVRTDRAHQAVREFVDEESPARVLIDSVETNTWNPLGTSDPHWVDSLNSDILSFEGDRVTNYEEIYVLLNPGLNDRTISAVLERYGNTCDARVTLLVPLPYLDNLCHSVYRHYLDRLIPEPELAFPSADELIETIIPRLNENHLLVLSNTRNKGPNGVPVNEFHARVSDETEADVLRISSRYYRYNGLVETLRIRSGGLIEYLSPDRIRLNETCVTKDDLFERLGKLHSGGNHGPSSSLVQEALWNRERLNETYLEDGIAMPHATVEGTRELTVALHVLEEPIRYSPGNDARIIVSLVGSPGHRQQQLYLIRTLMELFLEHDFEIFIREHLDPDVLWAELTGYGPEF